jgi:hypothetical protein
LRGSRPNARSQQRIFRGPSRRLRLEKMVRRPGTRLLPARHRRVLPNHRSSFRFRN